MTDTGMGLRSQRGNMMHPMTLTQTLRREALVNGVISLVMMTAVGWLTFRTSHPIEIWELDGAAVDLLPATFGPGVVMTVLLGLALRKRRTEGGMPATFGPAPHGVVARLAHRFL